jgi:hypothetical protein
MGGYPTSKRPDPKPPEVLAYPPAPTNLMWEMYARPLIDRHRVEVAATCRHASENVGRKVGKRAERVARHEAGEIPFP